MATTEEVRSRLGQGLAIPACPLALNAQRHWDERRQRALFRYYLAAGAGGLAVGVHTTQFAIRDPKIGLFRPVLEWAARTLKLDARPASSTATTALAAPGNPRDASSVSRPIGVAGICGRTPQALAEASVAADLGFGAGLLSLGAWRDATEDELLVHSRAVAEIIPLFGFYLQPAVGGRLLPPSFWRQFAAIENVVAIKIAPFNRYQTLDVIRAVTETGREDIALYTGNDDNIVSDLITPFRFPGPGKIGERRMVGGLLGHWAAWTSKAVELHAECRRLSLSGAPIPVELHRRAVEVTDANAALFDAENNFAGCIPGIHEVLRRQGLLEGTWCLDPAETLSPGQAAAIDRIYRAYPHLVDDDFVAQHRDAWLND
jgi:hypothetical protein